MHRVFTLAGQIARRRSVGLFCFSIFTLLLAGELWSMTISFGSVRDSVTFTSSPVGPVDGDETVRSELVRLQRATGLTFAWMHDGVNAVSFKRSTAMKVDNFLDSFRPDAFSFQQYPMVMAIDECWSHDRSKLVATVLDNPPNASLGLIDLKSKRTRIVAPNIGQAPHATSQCWSPDDRQFVYEVHGTVATYNIDTSKTTILVEGINPDWVLSPTWSPGGRSIAYLDYDVYDSISPTGDEKRKLFRDKGACSGLYWSPNSQLVAYVGIATILEGGVVPDAELHRLRFRRLSDGSETSFGISVDCGANFMWITSKELADRVDAQRNSR